ncbi:3D domain-containing protein [Paenibacillus sp. ISL-20]|uniref:3D domain-containing protein n=1 Tax=Paenibacillus sp. ISL-20 TaxID=2819163 RepID=UPI001BE9B538|nr:3D domain-containing protein [Paenibacillus sp. ISL-20]MBT2759915.1 3D domain-containing protein [Paenibacillus sp. ISL-20]
MWQMALSLLLTLSITQTEFKNVNEAREAKNTNIRQDLNVVKLAESERAETEVTKPKPKKINKKISNTDSDSDWILFEVTAYSNHYASTKKNPGDEAYGITYSGRPTVEGRTVAADINKYPIGTVLYIDGVGERVVEDIGGAIKRNRLDVYFKSEQDALNFGRKHEVKVKIIKMGDEK